MHHALEPEARADRCRCDAVLPRTRLGDDAALAEPDGEERLADRVVDLVCPGVEQVFALEQDSLAGRRKPGRLVERGRAPGEAGEQLVELGVKRGVLASLLPAARELVQRRDERLRDVAPAVVPVEAGGRRSAHRAAATYARTRS